MARRLNAIITIGGALTGGLRSALGDTRRGVDRIGGSIRDLERQQRRLGGSIRDVGRMGGNVDRLRERYRLTGEEIERLRRRHERMRREMELGGAIRGARGNLAGGMMGMGAGALGAGALLAAPLNAHKDLDEALTSMKVAMTDKTGALPSLFEEIKRQTIGLGNALPGTTADFVNLATVLKEQGVPMQVVANGALKSAAHLGVIMKLMPDQAGELVAKLREAFALQDNEFMTMADYTQRARFAFGLKSEDFLLGAKYYSGKLNSLGITGAENVRKVYAIQGLAAQQGMDGSTFGTNFSMMLTRVGLMTERLHKRSKEMRAVNAELKKSGVHMEFFTKEGKFAGVDNMVAQLDKLKVMTQEKRLQVLTRIFGEEGGRIAELISRMGVGGYQKAQQLQNNEGSLDQRIQISLKSYKNQLETLQGTWTNLLAAVGAPIADVFTPVLKTLNDIIGGPIGTFVKEHREAVGVIGTMVAATGGLLAVGAAIAAIGWAGTFAAGGLLSLGAPMAWMATTALPAIGTALAFVGKSLLLNPIGLAVTVLAGGAYLIYKNWEPVKGFFVGLFDGIKNTVGASVDWMIGKLDWVGTKWAAFKQWIGFDAAAPTAPGGPKVAPPALPPLPMPGVRAGGSTVNHNGPVSIQVVQQPGQSNTQLADEIMRKMKERQAVRQRSNMTDPVTP